jgi:protein required for attachment to host cells
MIIKAGTLILTADGARMRVLRNDGDAIKPALATIIETSGEGAPSSALGTDRPGRVQSSVGERRSGYEETDWHRQAEEEFAKMTAERLEKAASENPKSELVVVAASRTLGELRKHYGRETTARMVAEIDKDLAGHTEREVCAAVVEFE